MAALEDARVACRTEVPVPPYLADISLGSDGSEKGCLIEIDGPYHFERGTRRYNISTRLKHRLLTKSGWRVLHIAFDDRIAVDLTQGWG